MQEPVAHRRFVDVARFRIGDVECVIRTVRICFRRKLSMQGKHVVHQRKLEFLHIFLLPLPAYEFLPCFEQVLDGNDILVGMSEADSSPLRATPPPTDSAGYRACSSSI